MAASTDMVSAVKIAGAMVGAGQPEGETGGDDRRQADHPAGQTRSDPAVGRDDEQHHHQRGNGRHGRGPAVSRPADGESGHRHHQAEPPVGLAQGHDDRPHRPGGGDHRQHHRGGVATPVEDPQPDGGGRQRHGDGRQLEWSIGGRAAHVIGAVIR